MRKLTLSEQSHFLVAMMQTNAVEFKPLAVPMLRCRKKAMLFLMKHGIHGAMII
ncbi:hypothetical protein [Prevotella sp.]|uniref:hypothetical protein n=1 Tax=Prevotella sp. TaxID=59823 RepID=UPI00307FDBBE